MQFDAARAMRYNPITNLEFVRIVEKPADAETVIVTKLTGRETFVGSYVEVVDTETDSILYGYSYDRFIETHIPDEGFEDGLSSSDSLDAYPASPADAYQVEIEGELFSGRASGTQHVNAGDWIFRSPDGIWGTSAANFSLLFDLESARPIPQEPE
jgi:hypothetical protein